LILKWKKQKEPLPIFFEELEVIKEWGISFEEYSKLHRWDKKAMYYFLVKKNHEEARQMKAVADKNPPLPKLPNGLPEQKPVFRRRK